jgi:hypothetical protein
MRSRRGGDEKNNTTRLYQKKIICLYHLNIDPVLKRLAERLAAIGDGADI